VLLKGVIEKSPLHEFCVDMKVSTAGLDVVMAQHFLDFKDRGTAFQKILCIGMPERVRRSRRIDPVYLGADSHADSGCSDWTVGCGKCQKKPAVMAFGAGTDDICGNGFDGDLRQRDMNGIVTFSLMDSDQAFGKRNIIQTDL
jgi:hypothetical protein